MERERRFLLARIPDGVINKKKIVDRYLTGTRLRLREVEEDDGTVVRKLAHKVRLSEGPEEVACTNFYLADAEWSLLCGLPASLLRKTRHMVRRGGVVVAVDELEDGSEPSEFVPEWLEVVEVVTHDARWTGAGLAR